MRFLITSDWQVKFATLDASRRAHEQELRIIDKHKVDGHIDLGDLKDTFDPVEISVVKFQLARKKAIAQAVAHSITLMGNHDMLAQTAEHKNWFSLFDTVSTNNIQVPKVLHVGDCLFSCLPFMRSQKELIDAAKQLSIRSAKWTELDVKRILLFHCSVNGAIWNNITGIKAESKVTLEKLHTTKYDMCFGGHIHKYQKLSDNTIYVGNPYCNDAGEINQEKGFVLYDSEANEYKRIRSTVPGIYSWAFVKERNPTLVAGTRIKATVNCKPSEDYHKQLEAVAGAIEKQYPECISYVVPKFRIQDSTDTVEINPDSSDYDKIAQYIKATVPDELHKKRKALIRYVAYKLGNATSTGVRQAGKIIFDKVSATNVLSFQKVSFSFRQRGIVLIKGKNNDAVWNSNGAGKTNLLSLLPIAISGTTFKEQKNDAWANDNNKDKAKVTLDIVDDKNRHLSIVRQRRPTKLKFLIDDKDESIGRRHIGKKETQGRIEETIGYTFETLSNSVYIDSSLSNAFLTGTTADRAKLIHQFQNFDRFKVAKDIIGKEISALSKLNTEIATQKEVATELLEQLGKDIALAVKRKDENLKELKEKYSDARSNYKSLYQSYKQLLKTTKSLEARIAKKVAPLQATALAKEKERSVVQAAIEAKEEEFATFSSLGKLKKCPQCAQDLTDAHKKIVLARIKKALGAKKTEHKKLTVLIVAIAKEIVDHESPLRNLEKELSTLEDQVDEAKRKKDSYQENYNEARELAKDQSSDIAALKKRKVKLLRNLSRSNSVLQHHKDEFTFLKYAQASVSRDGLPLFLNKLLCPLLNRAAEHYSELFIDREIQVLFDIDDGHLVPKVINTHGGKSIASQSAGEKAWAGIITAFALREIAQPTNLLILDEPGSGLDSASAKLFGQRLSKLKNKIETILVVSHNVDICNALQDSNTVTVVKKNNVSSLR